MEILREIKEWGFNVKLVLADSLYGESGDVIGVLSQLKLHFIVAIRSNHPVWLLPGQRVRYNRAACLRTGTFPPTVRAQIYS